MTVIHAFSSEVFVTSMYTNHTTMAPQEQNTTEELSKIPGVSSAMEFYSTEENSSSSGLYDVNYGGIKALYEILDQIDFYESVNSYMLQIYTPTVFILGVCGNTLVVIIMYQKDLPAHSLSMMILAGKVYLQHLY